MSSIILACSILKDEVQRAVRETGKKHPIIWVDSTLHAYPEKLNNSLQEKIDSIENVENILFAYGCCGNALIGLKSSNANIIIPKIDDCISMLLCKKENCIEREKKTYFLTRGWLTSEKGLMEEYKHCIEKYGLERTKKIFKMMLNNYRYLMLIDTGAYPIEEYITKTQEIAEKVDLEFIIKQGTVRLIKKLLTGPWNEEFCFVPAGDSVELHHFELKNEQPVQRQLGF